MEREKKRMKQKKSEKVGFGERSPLQHLNGLQFHKSNSKKNSNLSSSSSVSVEAPNDCLRFLLSSNSCSEASFASSASSSSRTHLERKPKTLCRVTNNVSVKSSAVRSKENEVPKKPLSEKSKKNRRPCLEKRQYSKTDTKLTCKTAQRSELFPGQGNPVEIMNKGSEELAAKLKSSQGNGSGKPPIERSGKPIDSNLECIERCTPAGKRVPDFMSFDDCKNVREDSVSKTGEGDSATSVKTPPVEASVSPEIHCGSHSKMLVLKSAATPVCYGLGHLLSGVTDKRKRRRRGSLRGGCEKVNLFDNELNDRNVISDSQDSSIPLLAEASIRWLLSPCDEGRENQGSDSENRLDQCKMSLGNASSALDLLSSPSTFCENVSDLRCENSSHSGSGSAGDAASQRNARIVTPLLAATPNSASNRNSVSPGEGKDVRQNVIESNSAFSLGSLSSGNIIQTPHSDSSSFGCVGGSNVETHQRNFVQFELDSITEALNAASLSPRSKMSVQEAPSLSFQYADLDSSSSSIIPIQLQKNVDSVSSWVSDSTMESLALSQTRISWRDRLVHGIDENGESDCCPCLSDAEIDAVGCTGKQLMSYQLSQPGGGKEYDLGIKSCLRSHLGTKSGENENSALEMDNVVSPILVEYEPCISAQGKEKSSEDRLNVCAESICTNGGDLAASCDSDWTYLQEITCFRSSSYNWKMAANKLGTLSEEKASSSSLKSTFFSRQ